jgi:hypothetical protein
MTETQLAEKELDVNFLSPATLEFTYAENRLRLRCAGAEEWRVVSLARLFPLSEPEAWIAIIDDHEQELGLLRDLHGLSVGSVEAIREELERRYLIPQIQRIRACRDRFDLLEWEVETDRGPITFLMRHAHENIQLLPPHRLVFTDVEGNRFDVDDLTALDSQSQQWIERRL